MNQCWCGDTICVTHNLVSQSCILTFKVNMQDRKLCDHRRITKPSQIKPNVELIYLFFRKLAMEICFGKRLSLKKISANKKPTAFGWAGVVWTHLYVFAFSCSLRFRKISRRLRVCNLVAWYRYVSGVISLFRWWLKTGVLQAPLVTTSFSGFINSFRRTSASPR